MSLMQGEMSFTNIMVFGLMGQSEADHKDLSTEMASG